MIYFIDHKVVVRFLSKDGDAVSTGTVVAEAVGPVRALLLAERTAPEAAARRWASEVRHAQTKPDKRRAAHKVAECLLMFLNGQAKTDMERH